jgi:hypothetical protein
LVLVVRLKALLKPQTEAIQYLVQLLQLVVEAVAVKRLAGIAVLLVGPVVAVPVLLVVLPLEVVVLLHPVVKETPVVLLMLVVMVLVVAVVVQVLLVQQDKIQ